MMLANLIELNFTFVLFWGGDTVQAQGVCSSEMLSHGSALQVIAHFSPTIMIDNQLR